MAAESGVVSVEDGMLSKNTAIHVHLFGTSHAKLGKAKHADVARSMANSAPHLLAAVLLLIFPASPSLLAH